MPPKRPDSAQIDSEVLRETLAGDYRAVARLITLVENDPLKAVPYLRELYPYTGKGLSVGVTGAPGSGKSTLVDQLAANYRAAGRKVGIIAVDPTSPFSGGAILGDRIRMQSRNIDHGTFFRSMATRGYLGGLARATTDVQLILDAAGFDIILIETVGVGQGEVEIVRTAQTTLVLVVPGMGDDVQAMKAGIMEIGDIFVINKADRPGVERLETELNALLSMSARTDHWRPLVIRTVASAGQGIDECVGAIEGYAAFLRDSPFQKIRSVEIQRDRLLEVVRAQVLRKMLSRSETQARLDRLARQIAERKLDPYTAAERLLAETSD